MIALSLVALATGSFPDSRANGQIQPNQINLGLLVPAPLEAEAVAAGQLAVDQLNIKGGVLGKQVHLVIVQDPCANDAAAQQTIQTSLSKTPPDVLIGPFCEASTRVLLNWVSSRDKKLIAVSPMPPIKASGNEPLYLMTDLRRALGAGLSKYMTQDKRLSRFGVFYETRPDQIQTAQVLRGELERAGRSVSLFQDFGIRTDTSQLASAMAGTDIQSLVIVSSSVELSARIFRVIHEKELDRSLLSKSGIFPVSRAFISEAGQSGEGVVVASAFPPSGDYSRFVDAFRKKTGTYPSPEAGRVYDMLITQAEAIRSAGSLESYKNVPFAAGKAAGAFGDSYRVITSGGSKALLGSVYILQVQGTRFKLAGSYLLPCPRWPDC